MDEAGRKRADFVWYEEQQLKKASERIKHIRSTNKDALDLADLGLTYLPEAVCELQHIQELYLSGNRLTKLPVCLSRLKLRILDLNGNQFTHVPYAISQLEKLEMLGLANNLIDELPEWIWRLQALTDVDVEFNRLGALPESIRQLKSLQLLRLTGNAGLNLPAEILNGNNPSLILDYYFRAAGPLNEAKLILVGRGEVGKTSLVNQLIHDHFEPQMKTEGIQITRWPIKINSEEVRLHVWDFGGQEIMHATHQFFLTERSLYLVVLNGREGGEDADVEYWLKMIESFAGDSPVIIVLNKIRSHGFDLNRRGLQEKYLGRIVSFVRTDCIDGTGIEELRRAIIRSTDHLPHLRDRFPKSWFAIKDHLSIIQDTYNYVSFERYRELCKDHGESDQQAQELLATSLHCLGIALNYRDDPRLRDTHVLNPQWVTNGIYRILNSDLIESNRGEVSPDNLRSILDSTAYPPRMHDFLLNLMRKFELCFPFPDPRDNILLVPQLLGKEQPALGNEFEPGTCLNFRFAYSVLPEGIL